MKKILIVINDELYTRNYLKTGAFSNIDDRFYCVYAVSASVSGAKKILADKKNVLEYSYSDSLSDKHKRFHYLLMWLKRGHSKTFRYRYYRWLAVDKAVLFLREIKNRITNQEINLTISETLYLPVAALRHIFFSEQLWPILIPFLAAFMPKASLSILKPGACESLKKIIESVKPDLILMPSNAYNPECLDVVRLGHQVKSKTLFLIDNWDNLSSKTVFYVKPDFIAVWGEQSEEHAIRIHGFRKEQIRIIGTPRFDSYKDLRSTPSPFEFPYLLFTGCFLRFNEVECLKDIDREIDQNREIYGDLKVVYRPHPWRESRLRESMVYKLKNVVVDPQLDASLRDGVPNLAFQPDLNYYPRLLGNASLVIGPLTTMLIEGSLCGKEVLAIAYDDGSYTSPGMALKNYEHFIGIEDIDGLTVCTQRCDLTRILRHTVANPKVPKNRDALNRIVAHLFQDPYPQRIEALILDLFDYIDGSVKTNGFGQTQSTYHYKE